MQNTEERMKIQKVRLKKRLYNEKYTFETLRGALFSLMKNYFIVLAF